MKSRLAHARPDGGCHQGRQCQSASRARGFSQEEWVVPVRAPHHARRAWSVRARNWRLSCDHSGWSSRRGSSSPAWQRMPLSPCSQAPCPFCSDGFAYLPAPLRNRACQPSPRVGSAASGCTAQQPRSRSRPHREGSRGTADGAIASTRARDASQQGGSQLGASEVRHLPNGWTSIGESVCPDGKSARVHLLACNRLERVALRLDYQDI